MVVRLCVIMLSSARDPRVVKECMHDQPSGHTLHGLLHNLLLPFLLDIFWFLSACYGMQFCCEASDELRRAKSTPRRGSP